MTQDNKSAIEKSLIESIQSEVSKEASPLLDFLVGNASKIVGVIVLLIIAIVITGVINYRNKSAAEEARERLGKVALISSPAEKIKALEALAAENGKNKGAVLFTLATTLTENGEYEKAAKVWHEASGLADNQNSIIAKVGEAQSLSRAGQHAESLSFLEGLAADKKNAEYLPLLNSMIVDEAEITGRIDRAIKACEDLSESASMMVNPAAWKQRAEYLRQKKNMQ